MKAYLDWNATAPMLAEAQAAVQRAQQQAWGNPASVHAAGRRARRELEDAREAIAEVLGRSAHDLFFTSGGTEANNLALRALARGAALVVCSRMEHPSVTRVVEDLEAAGTTVCWVQPEADGVLPRGAFERALADAAPGALVCLQAVNHETGAIQPVAEVVELAHRYGARVHVDAVQAVGRLEPGVWRAADTVALTAHKLRGPQGIGAISVGGCTTLTPLMLGGSQEYGVRPGTQSAALAAGFAVAAQWAKTAGPSYDAVRVLRERLEQSLVELGAVINGGARRVGHVSNVSFPGLRGDEIVAALDAEGVCAASGSACASGSAELSPVVASMAGEVRARGAIRLSLGDTTTSDEIELATAALRRVLARARGMDEVLLEVSPHA